MAQAKQHRGKRRSETSLQIKAPSPIRIQPPQTSAASLIVPMGAAPKAQTIVYVHGIGNKPLASVLKCQWDRALFGTDLGDHSRMAYWVNRAYYPAEEDATCADGDVIEIDDDEATTRAIMALAAGRPTGEQEAIEQEISALTDDANQRAWLHSLAMRMQVAAEVSDHEVKAAGVATKVLPLPGFLRRLITRKLTRAFLRDVNDFFFHPTRRDVMTTSLAERLEAGGGPFVIIAHSQGSMIAYEVLRHLTKEQCDVHLLVTIGSPLGLEEVKDVFKQWTGRRRLPVPACVDRWVNVADRLDPVSFDTDISNDFTPKGQIENHSAIGLNRDSPRYPHSGTGYLRTDQVRGVVRDTVSNAFSQVVGRAIITSDLVMDLEDGLSQSRHKTLIQLQAEDGTPEPLNQVKERLIKTIKSMVKTKGMALEDAAIEEMRRFIAADLTRQEVEKLRTQFANLKIARIWRNMPKRALIHQSTHTVQARPANLGYGALGRDITWAVLDTGIAAGHPHFRTSKTVIRQWDCIVSGSPKLIEPKNKEFTTFDKNGHGTHVAATIAGKCQVRTAPGEAEIEFLGMAPETKLIGFKVLDDQGRGHDSYIIKALDLIAELNEASTRPVIHGVNLSLGGAFDPSVYGCGHTPLCQELRRLWRQGVLVCLAAGNEGYAVLQAASGELPINVDLSIGDPANLEEVIAVGSVHKTNPHTFGISYFSSRGPTADGRRKPDVVAPGEKILSAYHAWPTNKSAKAWTRDDLYIEMSGTSMATPHVSGILAAFLSVRREFIGYPDRLKTILMENCTDLGRDPYMQGAGLPNLVKMLANT